MGETEYQRLCEHAAHAHGRWIRAMRRTDTAWDILGANTSMRGDEIREAFCAKYGATQDAERQEELLDAFEILGSDLAVLESYQLILEGTFYAESVVDRQDIYRSSYELNDCRDMFFGALRLKPLPCGSSCARWASAPRSWTRCAPALTPFPRRSTFPPRTSAPAAPSCARRLASRARRCAPPPCALSKAWGSDGAGSADGSADGSGARRRRPLSSRRFLGFLWRFSCSCACGPGAQ